MDAFITIALPAEVPQDGETNKQGSGGYCVVFTKDLPVDQETNKQGSGGYCVVA